MPVGFNSPARNLFLLGSTGAQVVTNFFKTIDLSAETDGVYIPDEIKYNSLDQKYILAGTAQHNNFKEFGWFEKRTVSGASDWNVNIEASTNVNTSLRALELDSNNNLIVVGKTGDIPWIAKYSNGGVIDWQSTTNSADVEYTGITSDANGNYYACGSTPVEGEAQAFVEKFDASGNPGWGKSAFMLGRDVVLNKVAANTRGEVIAVGYLEDDSKVKGYIVKIDTNTGEVLWDRTLETDKITATIIRPCLCEDVYIDSKDQIYVVGRLFGISGSIGFVIKYTAEGNMIWQRETPEGERFEYYTVKSDGETEQTVVFGRYFDIDSNKYAGLLAKYNKDGTLVWRRKILSSFGAIRNPVNLDADPSFYYFLYTDEGTDPSFGDPDRYTFGKVSSTGNGLGAFQYTEGTGQLIDYEILTIQDKIGRISDGSVRNDSSDLITYPFNATSILFNDLATQVSNKRRQMDSADSFEYSGSPAIRPADFQELNLLGDVYSGSGNWLDQSGKGNDGVVNGATWDFSLGRWEFDGVNDYIDLGFNTHFSEVTLEVWAYKNTDGVFHSLIGKYRGDPAEFPSQITSYELLFNSTNGVRFHVTSSPIDTSSPLAANTWHHIVGTYDGTTAKIFVNGVEAVGGSRTAGNNTVPWRIGASARGANYLNGKIGEVRIYPRALTAAQVFQNYNATKRKYLYEGPETAPKITDKNIIIDNSLLLNYDFKNRATYDDKNENLIVFSNKPNSWTGNADFTIVGGYSDPFGGNNSWKVTNNDPGSAILYQSIGSVMSAYPVGTTFCASFWIKSVDGSTGTWGVNMYNGSSHSRRTVPITGKWQRVSFTFSSTNSGNIYWSDNRESLGDTNVAYVYGFQLNRYNTPATYFETGASAITKPTTVKNLSSSSYTGTIQNGAKFNSAGYFEFNRASANTIIAGNVLTLTSAFTIEAWVNPDSLSGSQNFLSKGNTYWLHREVTTNQYRVKYEDGSNRYEAISTTLASVGTWAHVVGTWDGSNLRIYINGSLEDTTATTATPLTNTENFAIGGYYSGGSTVDTFDGNIGESRVYDRALTATEVSKNFNATRAKYGV